MTFTSEKPKVPGAYWWKDESGLHLVNVKPSPTGELWAHGTDCMEGRVESMDGEWSERLVPVGEVEKAYEEVVITDLARHIARLERAVARARRVVEGKEEV